MTEQPYTTPRPAQENPALATEEGRVVRDQYGRLHKLDEKGNVVEEQEQGEQTQSQTQAEGAKTEQVSTRRRRSE